MIDPSNLGHFDHKQVNRQELLENMPKGMGGSLYLSQAEAEAGLFFSTG
jgi:hypothetical protein